MKKLFTCEAVTKGHPDKICDAVSDALLDAILSQDENAHAAIETMAAYDSLFLVGEVHADAKIDYEGIVKDKLAAIGYADPRWGFDPSKITIITKIHEQSADIRQGVDLKEAIGAGDQGMMFGFACSETENYMPFAYETAQKLAKRLDEIKSEYPSLGPDGKTQVTVEYAEDGKIKRIAAIVVSNQHDEKADLNQIITLIKKEVIEQVIPSEYLDDDTKIFINPTGKFVIGGPYGDSGLTGRKLIVDTYGGYAYHGGGAFSGKDPSKVDRSAAYYLRYIAKNVVAAGLCDKISLQAAYVIGNTKPVSLNIDTFGTNRIAEEKIYALIVKNFDLSVSNIIEELDLRHQRYQDLAVYGHFGRSDVKTRFERTDKAELLRSQAEEM